MENGSGAREDKEVASVDITDNHDTNFVYSLDSDITGYYEVDIIINSLAIPDQRARIETITLGVIKIFTNKDIISYKMNSSIALINDALPTNTINFELDNTNDMFNPDNRNGLFTYLSKRQEIKIFSRE